MYIYTYTGLYALYTIQRLRVAMPLGRPKPSPKPSAPPPNPEDAVYEDLDAIAPPSGRRQGQGGEKVKETPGKVKNTADKWTGVTDYESLSTVEDPDKRDYECLDNKERSGDWLKGVVSTGRGFFAGPGICGEGTPSRGFLVAWVCCTLVVVVIISIPGWILYFKGRSTSGKLYIYMYTNIYIYIHVPVYIYMCQYSYACSGILIHVPVYIYMFRYTYTCTGKYICAGGIHLNEPVYMYTCADIYQHLPVYIYLSPTSDKSRPLFGQLARVYELVCQGKYCMLG